MRTLEKLREKIQTSIIDVRTVEYLQMMIEDDRLVITSYDSHLSHIRWEISYEGKTVKGKRRYRIHYPNGFSWVLPTKEFLIMLASQLTAERISTIYKKE